jgi:hypothetical protein
MIRELAKSFRAFTASPITAALNQAHQMARRHLETGGAAVASGGQGAGHEFELPHDIDLAAMDTAIQAKLRGGDGAGRARPSALHIDKNWRVLVPGDYVQRLGDGDFERGKRWLDQVINDVRRQRVLLTARRAVATRRRPSAGFCEPGATVEPFMPRTVVLALSGGNAAYGKRVKRHQSGVCLDVNQ